MITLFLISSSRLFEWQKARRHVTHGRPRLKETSNNAGSAAIKNSIISIWPHTNALQGGSASSVKPIIDHDPWYVWLQGMNPFASIYLEKSIHYIP